MFAALALALALLLALFVPRCSAQTPAAAVELFKLVEHSAPLLDVEAHLRAHLEHLERHEQYQLLDSQQPGQLWTPLIFASSVGNSELVRLLLHYGANPNIEEADGFTALLFAAHSSSPRAAAAVEALLHRGANVYHESSNGDTALSLASTPAARALLESRLEANDELQGGGEFLELVRLGDLAQVEAAIAERGVHIINGERNKLGWSALTFSAAAGEEGEALLALLLANGAQPNQVERDGWTPLMFSTATKCTACVELLLDAGALVDEDFGRLVSLAENHGEIVSTLAGAGLRQHLDGKRITPGGGFIMDAGAIMGFVRAGANPNTPNAQGVTALMLLAQTGEVEAVKDLLLDGANVNWQENDGWTPLMFAVHDGHLATFRLLLQADGVDLALRNKHGDTALDVARAIGGDNSHFVRLLREAGGGGGGAGGGGGGAGVGGGSGSGSEGGSNSIFKFFGF